MTSVRRLRRASAAAVVVLACARIQPPPGGPEDLAPPILLGVTPDSLLSLPDWDDDVEFRFDEVISEGSQPNFGLGTGDLEKLVLLSPSEEVPVVRWRRSRITVKPREGWRRNTVYRVELLAGVQDLRRNIARRPVVVTFTTGDELPRDSLRGRVVDWTNRRPVPQALVEAVLMPDSLVYRTATDSSGRFKLVPLPAGEYLVFGVLDQNRNQRRDGREAFDSVRIAPGRDSVGELWAFRRDTTPPRIRTVAVQDSVTLQVTFVQQLDPYQRLDRDSARALLLPDSSAVGVEAALPREALDSLFPRAPLDTAAADTAGVPPPPAPPDTAPPPVAPVRRPPGLRPAGAQDTTDTGPLTSRPALSERLLVRLGEPVVPGSRYVVELRGVRTVSGVTGTAQGVLTVPQRQPVPGDTTAARDTTPPPPPPPPPPPAPPLLSRSRRLGHPARLR